MRHYRIASLVTGFALSLVPIGYFLGTSYFLQDDFGQIADSQLTYAQQVANWKEIWGFRPVSLVALPGLIQLFGFEWHLYAGLNFLLYAFCIWAFLWKRSPGWDLKQKLFATGLGLGPAMASTILFSPVNQLSASISLFLVSLGHLTLNSKSSLPRMPQQLLVFFLFTASLFAYEVSAPLIFWSAMLGLSAEFTNLRDWRFKFGDSKIYIVPALASVLVSLTWQKIAAPLFLDSTFSRANGISLYSLGTFFYGLTVTFPAQLIRMLVDYSTLAVLVAAAFWLLWFRSNLHHDKLPQPSLAGIQNHPLLALLALISGAALFTISGAGVDLTGYVNRGLSSIWILVAINLTFLFERALPKRIAGIAMSITLALNFVWFSEKVHESQLASDLRIKISSNLARYVSSLPPDKTDKISIVADVPCLLPRGNSDIDIFCSSWDLLGSLAVQSTQVSNVLTMWDWGYPAALENISGRGPVVTVVFDDLGNFVSATRSLSAPPRVSIFNRSPGGKSFLARDCLDPLVFVPPKIPESRPSWVNCVTNPF